MIPKVVFRYSRVYDERQRSSKTLQAELKKSGKEYPSSESIARYIKQVEKIWRKVEKKVLIEISKTSGLKWKDKEIRCYIVGVIRPFSDPLTIRVYKSKQRFVDVLAHELIHQIQIQNFKKTKVWFNSLFERYPEEARITRSHIFLHALHMHIYLKLFNRRRLNKDISICEKHREYKRAWEIVKKEGYENIIRDFRNSLKKS